MFVLIWTIIEFFERIICLNFFRTFLIDVLINRWIVFSIISIFHLLIQISFVRIRISFLIATTKIFEFDTVETRLFVFENFYFVVFLTISFVVSLSEIFMWIEIQCMWKNFSQLFILWIKTRKIYWFNYCLKNLMILITAWLSMNIFIIVFSKWIFIMFNIKFNFINSFEYIVYSMKNFK